MMTSPMAMALGTASTTAAAAPGDVTAEEWTNSFLAALCAAQPPAVPLTSKPQQAQPAAGDEAGDPTTELAALVAAMLPAGAVPEQDAAATVQAAAAEIASGKTPSSPAAAALRNWLVGMQAAADPEAMPPADVDPDNAGDEPAPAIKPEAPGSTPAAPVQAGLRQLLEMMGRASSAPHADAQGSDQRTTGSAPQAADPPPGMPLARGEGKSEGERRIIAATAPAIESSAPSALSAPAAPPTAAAPNALLAAASTNFGSPVHQPAQPTADPGQTLNTAVGTARWAEELGSRLTLMAVRGQHEGSLNLTPEHLGPVEVRISVNQNTANVWFGAQHADARAALTEALPRLREMFGASGMTLGHADVSQQAPGRGSRETAPVRTGAIQAGAATDGVDSGPLPARIALGLVDTYV